MESKMLITLGERGRRKTSKTKGGERRCRSLNKWSFGKNGKKEQSEKGEGESLNRRQVGGGDQGNCQKKGEGDVKKKKKGRGK